ncbi:co-chaperone GroES [Planctomycetota bacterium]|nr:co-chaperone GroES [Planctomycetota bacterium]
MKVRPLGDKILVKRLEAVEKTTSGIFLPESAKEKPQQATVIAIGDGKLLKNGERAGFSVKVGDVIILNKWGGTEVKIDGEEYMVMAEDEVLAIVG